MASSWLPYIASSEFFLFFVLSFGVILLFQSNNLYKINVVLSRSLQLVIIIHSFFYIILGLATIVFFIHSDWIIESRSAVAYFGLLAALGIASYRLLIFRPLYIYLNKKEIMRKNVVIVGSNLAAKNLAIQMDLDYSYGFHLIGFIDDAMPVGTEVFEKYKLLGTLEELPKIVAESNINEIIVTVSETDHKQLFDILDICKQTTAQVMVTSSLFDVLNKEVYSERYFNIPIVRLTNTIDNKVLLMMKRCFDIVGSLSGLLVFPFH